MAAAPKLTDPRGSSTPAKHRVNPWVIAAVVSLAAFMEVLDTSIANVALPYMAGGLAASLDDASWVLTSYLVATQALLHVLCRDLHNQFVPMRNRTIARNVDPVSHYTGRRRGRFAAGIAGNLAGHFSA
jgi:MFS family permease